MPARLRSHSTTAYRHISKKSAVILPMTMPLCSFLASSLPISAKYMTSPQNTATSMTAKARAKSVLIMPPDILLFFIGAPYCK